MREVFSEELANDATFSKEVSKIFDSFYSKGARATLRECIS